MSRVTLRIVALLFVTACGASGPVLSRAGLTDDRYALHVAAVSPGVFVSNDWMVENFVRVEPGPVKLKRGEAYDAIYRLDLNNDGRADEFREHGYVLKLRHRRNVGVLWSSVVPLPRSMEQTELRVLARLLVDAASRDTVSLSVVERTLEVSTRRLATRMLDQGPVAVRGYEGYRVVFEVADVDQESLTPNASWERREVMLVRPGFVWLAHRRVPAPGLLLIGHANLPDDFASTQPDFERFVAAFEFREAELEGSRRALAACAPNAELVGVARINELPQRYASIGDEDAGDCFAETRPENEPPVSFGVRREPFVAPVAAAAEPPTTVTTPEPSAESTTPATESSTEAAEVPAPTVP
jgi:hypothetical protein